MLDLSWLIKYGESRGAGFVDIRFHDRTYELIVLDNGVVKQYTVSTSKGVGVRVVVDKFFGYASTNRLDKDSLMEAVDRAISVAKSMSRFGLPIELFERKIVRDRVTSKFSIDPFTVDSSEKISVLKDMYSITRDFKDIISCLARFGYEYDNRFYQSSWGDEVEVTNRLIGISILTVAKVNGVVERVHDQKSMVAGWEFIKSTDWCEFSRDVAQITVQAAKSPAVKPGRYDAVLDNEMVGLLLHEAFGHATEADIVEAGGSVLEGRVGERIASDYVTVVDDGLVEGGFYLPYDDEGSPKVKTVTVDRGVLKTYLHSLWTAKRFDSKPTGNARVMDYEQVILIRQTNTYMEPGDHSVDELFEDIKEGVYVRGRGAMGGQVDPSMGTFTFTAGPSYLVKNGRVESLIRGVMISGNILETLKNVDAVAKDLKVTTSVFGGCGKDGQMVRVGDGGPHIRVRGLVIGGGV